MFDKPILLSTPTMHGEELQFVNEAFARNWIAPLGFNCDNLEAELSAYLADGDKAPHVLALSSGTAALHLAVKLAGVRAGDVVLCSDLTFAATVNPVCYEGGVPVFVDSERETWNMDPVALERAFEKYPNAKAVIAVHLYGTPAAFDEIASICHRHGAVLIEDAAEAMSATYKGRQCGTLGDIGIFSFNGNKIITTSGGGALLTRDAASREKAFFWATQAREKALWYQHSEIGYNYRMSNVCAGIGRGQLLHLEEHRARKGEIFQRYRNAFADLPLSMNPYALDTNPNFWLSCILIDPAAQRSPLEVIERLKREGIEARPIWKPMHLQPVFADRDFVSAAESSVAEDVFARGLCLPSDIKMTKEEQDRVIAVVRACF
jgi:dTDP-4-amino-4,6-dideoxygalactose transaminase